MMATWRDDKILELANQLSYSPADNRHEQLTAAIALVPDIDPHKPYPWDFIHFRLTGFNPVQHIDHVLPGDILLADLSTLIEFLSDTLSIKIEDATTDGRTVHSIEDVSRKFSVSTKTVQRWRKDGLIALRYVYPDGRRRLGFPDSALQHFADANKNRIERSASFKQLSDDEKDRIIELARGLSGLFNLKDLCARIAEELDRAPETIRYTIRKHDREHPSEAIFPDKSAPPHAPLPGPSVLNTSVLRLITHERARKVKTLKITFVPNPLFDHPDADNIILNVLPAEALAKAQATVAAGINTAAEDVYMARIPRDLPDYLADVFRQPIMPHELELDSFRRLNYLRCKAARLQARIDPENATPADLAQVESLLLQATNIKNQLIQNSLRVAVHVARKHQRAGRMLPELVSDATIWLMRAVDKFDFARPTRFSTYASYAIMKNFARYRAEQLTRTDKHLVTGQEEVLNAAGAPEGEAITDQLDAATLQSDLMSVIGQLPDRERELLTHHYGLDQTQPALSLSEIGDKMGITKARVRQLEARALRKLRQLIEARRNMLRNAASKKP